MGSQFKTDQNKRIDPTMLILLFIKIYKSISLCPSISAASQDSQ